MRLSVQSGQDLGDDRSALHYFERAAALTDSLHAEEVRKGLERIEFNRRVMADSLRRAEEKAQADATKGKSVTTPWLIGGGAVATLAVVIAARRRRKARAGSA